MMKTWPLLMSVAANAVMFTLPVAGGNPIFATVRLLSKPELIILTTGNGAFVGGTIAHRIGKTLDMVTGGTLVADFGLYSGYRYIRRQIKAYTAPKAITQDEQVSLIGAVSQ
jgi:hypothetical protein